EGRRDSKTFRLLITQSDSAELLGTVLFADPRLAVNDLRRQQLALASKYVLPKNLQLSDNYLLSKLRAAEADASRQLRVYFQPTVIIPDDASQEEVDALESAEIAYAQEATYDYDAHFFTGERWGYIVTKEKPIISVQSIKFAYPSPTNQVFSIPDSWIRLDKKFGHIRLVPATQSFSAPLSAFIMQALGGG